ncbi:MAG: hypothetical protein A2Y33_13265 [Spirochaetes bacterium GWF1_51_8]|nr:MAG: hypothetical protein A2Y33_13265 [Spirochaetes bacterium GWF1_51_8]
MENDNKCTLCDKPAKKIDLTPRPFGVWKVDCTDCGCFAILDIDEQFIRKNYFNQRHFISNHIKNNPVNTGDDVIPLKRVDMINIIERGQSELELRDKPRTIGFK